MQQGLVHLSLPLWLGSRGPKVLSRDTGGHSHRDCWGSWRAAIRVRVHVAIVSDTSWGEARWEDGPRGDWRDGGVRPRVVSGRWEVAEPADGCEAIVEVFAAMVIRQELGCEPDRHEGRHEGTCLVGEGELVNNR